MRFVVIAVMLAGCVAPPPQQPNWVQNVLARSAANNAAQSGPNWLPPSQLTGKQWMAQEDAKDAYYKTHVRPLKPGVLRPQQCTVGGRCNFETNGTYERCIGMAARGASSSQMLNAGCAEYYDL